MFRLRSMSGTLKVRLVSLLFRPAAGRGKMLEERRSECVLGERLTHDQVGILRGLGNARPDIGR